MKKLILLLFLAVTSLNAQIITIKHKAYEIHFDTKLKEPIFTHYFLTKSMLNGKNARTLFHFDSAVPNSQQNGTSLTGYDKGHLSPDDDFRADITTESESMVYTNEAPQVSSFNRGTWKSLENHVRDLAKNNKVEVWTGCIYGSSNIPLYFWKVISYGNSLESYKLPNNANVLKDYTIYKVDAKELLKLIQK